MAGELIVGVTGGVAAFKTAALVSDLAKSGMGVTVVMTESATRLVGTDLFAALSGRPVATSTFDPAYPLGAHIELAERGDLLCVAPASADYMAKAACGLADDLLSTLTLAFQGPVLLAPAMNTHMWNKPATQRNLQQLRDDGLHIVDPQEGWLSCRTSGVGRMAEPDEIAARIRQLLGDG